MCEGWEDLIEEEPAEGRAEGMFLTKCVFKMHLEGKRSRRPN